MLPRLCCPLLCILLVSLPLQTHSARRSRIDAPALPIQNSADAPLEDNLATASGSEPAAVVVAAEPLANNTAAALVKVEEAPPPAPPAPVAAAVTQEEPEKLTDVPPIDAPTLDECETDNIGYEIVTG